MQQLITTLHIIIAAFLILLVLIQRGKGSDMGAGFGAGASGTMFGSQGATPFLVKLTAGLAILFYLSSGVLSFIVGKQAAAQAEGTPFVSTAPMKQVEAIPVSQEVQQGEGAKAAVAPAPVVAKPAAPKSEPKKTKQQ